MDKSDFNSGSFTAEMSVNVTSRLDITGGIDFNGMSQPSEDRDEEELLPNGSRVPIEQVTELEQMNLFASAKFLVLPRGRRVSSLAWIPNTFVPYVGAGAGYGKYNLRQNGDFVDFVDHHIFTDTFRLRRLGADSTSWAGPTFRSAPSRPVVRSALLLAARRPGYRLC